MRVELAARIFQQQVHFLEAALIRDPEQISQIDGRIKMAGYQQQIDSLSSQIRSLAEVVKRLSEKLSNKG